MNIPFEKKTNKAFQNVWLSAVDQYICENIGNSNLVVSDIAIAVFMSERQFYRRIKKLTGKTPNQYLQYKRMEHAKKLLELKTFSSVKDVCLSVGYTRSDYFSNLFQEYYGVRPISYMDF